MAEEGETAPSPRGGRPMLQAGAHSETGSSSPRSGGGVSHHGGGGGGGAGGVDGEGHSLAVGDSLGVAGCGDLDPMYSGQMAERCCVNRTTTRGEYAFIVTFLVMLFVAVVGIMLSTAPFSTSSVGPVDLPAYAQIIAPQIIMLAVTILGVLQHLRSGTFNSALVATIIGFYFTLQWLVSTLSPLTSLLDSKQPLPTFCAAGSIDSTRCTNGKMLGVAILLVWFLQFFWSVYAAVLLRRQFVAGSAPADRTQPVQISFAFAVIGAIGWVVLSCSAIASITTLQSATTFSLQYRQDPLLSAQVPLYAVAMIATHTLQFWVHTGAMNYLNPALLVNGVSVAVFWATFGYHTRRTSNYWSTDSPCGGAIAGTTTVQGPLPICDAQRAEVAGVALSSISLLLSLLYLCYIRYKVHVAGAH